MKVLFRAFQRLTVAQKVAVSVMLVLIVVTWSAVCLILASYLAL